MYNVWIEVLAYDPVEMREFLEIKSQRDYSEMIEILVFQITLIQ